MDDAFLKRALKVTSFNLFAKDFESLDHKEEIQHLFNVHFFSSGTPKFITGALTETNLRAAINKLRVIDAGNFQSLHTYNVKGVGPGEVTLYYLINKAHLGGGSSAGLDLVVGSKGYEIKAVDASPQGYVNNFKVGGTFSLADIIQRVAALKKKAKLGAGAEINSGQLQKIYEKYPKELQSCYDDFATITYDNYFKNHDIIFLSNKNGGGYQLGDVIRIMRVQKKDIRFERITSGTIKPRVFFK